MTYNGNSQSPTWSNYSATKTTIGGTTSGTNAGNYNATFTPTADYRWSDGSTTAKTVVWSIGKAAGSLSISPTSITLNASNRSKTITVTRAGNGVVSASSNNTGVAKVTVSGTTVTVSSVNDTTGNATITISVAAGTNHTAPASKTCAVTASFKPTASTAATSGVNYTSGLSGVAASDVTLFAEAISNNSSITNATSTVYIDFGSVHRKVSVGDQVTLALNGTSYTFDVIGFNHDTLTTSTAYGAATKTGKRDHLNVFGNDYPTPDGTGVRDYIHVVDLAKGHVAAIQYLMNHNGENIFNLGTGRGYSVLDMVHAFEEGNDVVVPYQIAARRQGDLPICYADTSKSTELLGWKAEKSLIDMCRDTWNWQKQNPDGYGG